MPKVTQKSIRPNDGSSGLADNVPLDPDAVLPVNLSAMNLEAFSLWSSAALKAFLSLRNKSTDGTFNELAARAYIAYEENIPVSTTEEHELRRALEDYKRKLLVGGVVLPDPFTIKNGWIKEAEGMRLWPSLYLIDMVDYLKLNTPSELVHRLLNEYKQGKAYRYFTSGWVGEVLFHHVHDASTVGLFSSKVKPSMRLNDRPYEVWVAVNKQRGDVAGGEILSAYCTCTAGLHGTCNHVCGVLFRIEAAVKSGMNITSCTSEPCRWNMPSTAAIKPSVPVQLSSVEFKKEQYMQQSIRLKDRAKSVRHLAT